MYYVFATSEGRTYETNYPQLDWSATKPQWTLLTAGIYHSSLSPRVNMMYYVFATSEGSPDETNHPL